MSITLPTASPARDRAAPEAVTGLSWRSYLGINAANFFLAEVTGVAMPFVNDYLKDRHWQPFAIGLATAIAGLGVFLAQTAAGFLTDRILQRRLLLGTASLVLGVCYGVLPFVPATHLWVDGLLFTAGVAQSFFTPVLGALALALVGHAGINRLMGVNQGANHAGNLAAAVVALVVVALFGLTGVFVTVLAVSVLAAGSLLLIRPDDLDEARGSGLTDPDAKPVRFRHLLRDKRILVLFGATALFHLANAPVMPLVAQDVKELGGSHSQVALVVLVAQAVMVPVALLTGLLIDRWGRKPVFAIGFVALPVRIALYAFATTPGELIAIQTLDGIGAGIYGVAIVAMCADLTRGKGGFNALSGLIATALSVGGVLGPLGTGALVQYLGYPAAFAAFAGIAALAAGLFLGFMPETREDASHA